MMLESKNLWELCRELGIKTIPGYYFVKEAVEQFRQQSKRYQEKLAEAKD